MKRFKKLIWITCLVMFISLLGFFGGWISGASRSATGDAGLTEDIYDSLRPLIQSMSLIRNNYVDVKKIKQKELVYGAIKGMVEELDPYSQFMDPQTYKDMCQETKGVFGGLGIEIGMRNNRLTIISPIEGTPAFRAKLQLGDEIMKIDDESTEGITIMDAVHKMRGLKGTKCVITIRRQGVEEWFDVPIIRDVIEIDTVRYEMLEGSIGYIRVMEFMERTGKDFDKALNDLQNREMKGLILDLRNNPGGLLKMAPEIAEYFVPKGKLIVYTEGRHKTQNLRFFSTRKDTYNGKPLVVLVNQGSASASEIVAGAIQDLDLGIIVGQKTFGKGSVQTIVPLGDGSALRMTTASYFTPKGGLIHGNGITPDFLVEAYRPNEFYIQLIKERRFEEFARFYLKWYPQGEEKKAKKSSVEVSEKSWKKLKPETPDQKLRKSFVQWLKEQHVEVNQHQINQDLSFILNRIREEIAKKLHGIKAARMVRLEGDPQVLRAKDAIKLSLKYKKK
ncbi:S41 family peptidase [bacterium]|nr:S41 family peptidase [bacterium]